MPQRPALGAAIFVALLAAGLHAAPGGITFGMSDSSRLGCGRQEGKGVPAVKVAVKSQQSKQYTAQLQLGGRLAQQQESQVASKLQQRKLLQQTGFDATSTDTSAGQNLTNTGTAAVGDLQPAAQPALEPNSTAAAAQPANGTSSAGIDSTVAQPMLVNGSQKKVVQNEVTDETSMPSATPAQMRKAQVGTPNDLPTVPEGNIPVVPTPPPASSPLYITPTATIESTTEIGMDQELLQIPQSFLGLSHEWTHVEELSNIPNYTDILNKLTQYGSGPMIIRVGGGSTDKLTQVPPQYVYEALGQVYQGISAQFIVGINFESSDLELSMGQFDAARRYMPPGSIITFEIGNEPNYYEGTKKDSQGQALTAVQYLNGNFVPDWYSLAKQLSCPCGTSDCCTYKQFAGPVWGHVHVFPTTMQWFLNQTANFVSLTTLHWYKATKESYNTPITLLEEAPIRAEMENLRALVQTSQAFGIPLRVAEMNTISNSGRVGVSNVFAAALWTLDGCFEVAATGAVGVNLHQGSGQNLYTAILRWYNQNVLSPPVLRPPFFGMLMFQQAIKAGSKLLAKTQASGDSSTLKVWPLIDVSDKELRVVVVNKHPTQAGNQTIVLNLLVGSTYNSVASVSRLVARGEDALSATTGITIGGLYYAVGGAQQGEDAVETVAMTPTADGRVSWTIYMPPGSAALASVGCVT